jgi:hypothetical protein
VYSTHNSGLSACLPMLNVTFWCPGMSSKDVNTRLDAVSTRSLPVMFACPLYLCILVGRPSLIPYCSEVTMAAISGVWWW